MSVLRRALRGALLGLAGYAVGYALAFLAGLAVPVVALLPSKFHGRRGRFSYTVTLRGYRHWPRLQFNYSGRHSFRSVCFLQGKPALSLAYLRPHYSKHYAAPCGCLPQPVWCGNCPPF